jgi:hypothetical protein
MRRIKSYIAKISAFMVLLYSNAVCAALAPSFVKIEETKGKGLFDILQNNIIKAFILFGTVMGAYYFLSVGGQFFEAFGEARKTGEWSKFIPVLIFGLLVLGVSVLLIYLGLDALPGEV